MKFARFRAALQIFLASWLFVAGAGCGDDDDRRPAATPTQTTTSMPTPTSTPMASFQGVGFLSETPGTTSGSFGISRDGTTVVGISQSPEVFEAFRWRAASGIEGLGFPANKVNSEALAASQGGSVVAGTGFGFGKTAPRAARWSESAGWQPIESDSEDFDVVNSRGISADGNTVAGAVQLVGTIIFEPFRWTSTGGIRLLGRLEGLSTEATGLSADGAVVSAFAFLSGDDTAALRWENDTGLVELPMLEETSSCFAQSVSSDGSTIVGCCGPDEDPEAVLWDSRGVVGLGDLPDGIGSRARAASADGSVVVGLAGNEEGVARAAIWTAATGWRDLREVLIGLGLSAELEGWFLNEANVISDDGRTIAGTGRDPQGRSQGFVATLP